MKNLSKYLLSNKTRSFIKTGICLKCKSIFFTLLKNQYSCGKSCARKLSKTPPTFYDCLNCNKTFTVDKGYNPSTKRHFCSHKCAYAFMRGKNHHMWTGGRSINNNGYERIKINCKDISYHRYVMEKHLNRKLKINEHIHHIDGNKLNNNIENLKIVTPAEHNYIHHYGKKLKRRNKQFAPTTNNHSSL